MPEQLMNPWWPMYGVLVCHSSFHLYHICCVGGVANDYVAQRLELQAHGNDRVHLQRVGRRGSYS